MEPEGTAWEGLSAVRVVPTAQRRKLAKVPFVELADGRLQGVVSSGSDIERVYVSAIDARTHAYHCSTNNNRPCGGLSTAPCKHLNLLAGEALVQYGTARVARYLGVDPAGLERGADLLHRLSGRHQPIPAAAVFSSFLRHLSYLELSGSIEPLAELHWFPAGVGQ